MRFPTTEEIQWGLGIVGSIAAGAKWAVPRLKQSRPVRAVRDHFVGVHQMFEKMDRVEGKVTAIEGKVDAIEKRVEYELGTNGGGSLKDQVTRIAGRQEAVFDGQNRPAFQTDAHGNFISVNRAFERRTGFPARDLVGKGWVNLLHEDCVEDFMAAWDHMVRDGRPLRRKCTIVTAAGAVAEISVNAIPIRRTDRKGNVIVIEWQGDFDGLETLAGVPA